jgi:hypothetical protein
MTQKPHFLQIQITTSRNTSYHATMAAQDEQTPLSSSSSESGFSVTRCLGCFNLGAVSILSIAVVWIFLQLQVVTYKLTQATRHIDEVLYKVTNDQQAQIEHLNVKVEEEHDLTILHMAGTFALLSGLISMFHMTAHLRNMNEPFVQRKILAILWMPPIYAVTSFLSLVWPVMEGYLSIIKDFYEAYVIYTFLSFLIAVMGRGDRNVVVQRLALHADHLDKPTKCLSSCYHPSPEESPEAKAKAVLMECQILAMQFVFCRPLTSIASFVFMTLSQVETDNVVSGNNSTDYGAEDTGTSGWAYFTSPLFYIAMIQNVSVFFAFSGMLKFYHAVRDDLQWYVSYAETRSAFHIVFPNDSIALCVQVPAIFQVSRNKGRRVHDFLARPCYFHHLQSASRWSLGGHGQ